MPKTYIFVDVYEKNSFFYLYKVLLTHDLEIGYVESRGDINLGIAKCCFTRIIG